MAGKKRFVTEEVLDKAMQSFWQYGYRATSMQDLVQTMGINRGSLYDTFGDKQALFLASLDHYRHTVMATFLQPLTAPGAGKQAIVDFIQGLVDHAVMDRDRKGCLITNTAIEQPDQDPAVAERIRTCMSLLETAFYQVLVQARAAGELGDVGDLRTVAQYLTSSVQGLRVIGKTKPDPIVLQGIANMILTALDP